jgi:phenylpyruvate tautomerase PptA (4-oxalocrotonate tautomerase family)
VPNVTIEVRKRYTREQEEAIIDAVHAALMEGIKTPEWDKTIRLIVHEPHRFATPPQKGERGGGVPASEVDLGFKVDV